MKQIGIILFLTLSIIANAIAQNETDTLPSVFMIGEYEQQYNTMLSVQPDLLMSVCEGDMEKAYNNWLNFLVAMEQFAIEQKVDINGIKIWINVFWNEDGSLKHIAFYPKPNSKNMEYEYVKVLFSQFSAQYTSELQNEKIFCHYGSASFPSFITTSAKEEK
ncbi:hypothetical protein N9B82_01350 [Saprospiraceae bacterium]|nr:hypothetical protein [Saprospiraceae bacterium]